MDQQPTTYGSYQTACKNKKQYGTYREAKTAAKKLKKDKGVRVRPYECIYCGQWHNGHNRQKMFKRLNAGKIKAVKSIDKR